MNNNKLGSQNLTALEKTKRVNSYKCTECGELIQIGERYISVTYNDGFIKKSYGAFHLKCYEI